MPCKHYIVDVWIDDDAITQDELDRRMAAALEIKTSVLHAITYDVNFMAETNSEGDPV